MIGLHCIDEILDQSKDYDWKLIEKKIVFAESNSASVQYGKVLQGWKYKNKYWGISSEGQ